MRSLYTKNEREYIGRKLQESNDNREEKAQADHDKDGGTVIGKVIKQTVYAKKNKKRQ